MNIWGASLKHINITVSAAAAAAATTTTKYEGVSRSFRTDRLERQLQMVQLSATRYCCIAIL